MSQTLNSFQLGEPEPPALTQSPVAAIYTHPDQVVSDPELTTADKRAVLASWISDARAVENVPTLRWLDSGAVVEVDAIRRALASLDGLASRQGAAEWPPLSRRRPSVFSRWLSRARPPNSANDNDDDPPPAPAGVGIPFRPNFVAADSERPLLGPASATRMSGRKRLPPQRGKGMPPLAFFPTVTELCTGVA